MQTGSGTAMAQDRVFSVDEYQAFLAQYPQVSADELLSLHPAGVFRRQISSQFQGALYADSIDTYYSLTASEKAMVGRHGFVVTERIQPNSFGSAFVDIYRRDLPVFISSDAILHAFHMSYDLILRQTEESVIIPRLQSLLDRLHEEVGLYAARSDFSPSMQTNVEDLDLFLVVARSLLSGELVEAAFAATLARQDDILARVAAETDSQHPLFSETCRVIDYSQFTPRGHYTLSEELTRYFKAMMWLGRTEFYLIAPETARCKPSDADVQRQSVDAVLMQELVASAQVRDALRDIDEIIAFFVGEPDNVTLDHLERLMQESGIGSAVDLQDEATWVAFQALLSEKSYATQRINSQILYSTNISDPDGLAPASAFMLLGQRFVIDSYVTGHVVYDEVPPSPEARILPSTYDVLFSLGNDAAGQLLTEEIQRYGYGEQLAALRYLIDGYDESFWRSTIYNGWLDSIRELNPPEDRSHLPPFMQTAAWWQQKMTTQLAAWAQLRHDNLLYAKQSYTGGIVCEYPYSYVEPIPGFFERISTLSRDISTRFSGLEIDGWSGRRVVSFFDNFAAVSDTLASIAHKEIRGEMLNAGDSSFLRRMIREPLTCGPTIDGWYTTLYFGGADQSVIPDLVVADIHTAPTDGSGNDVGWVMHAGTGPLDMAFLTAEVAGVGPVSFVGPVMSYYEHVSTNYLRLSDEAWQTAYAAEPSFRPDNVNLYLANGEGENRSVGVTLVTDVERTPGVLPDARQPLIAANYPNPFSKGTVLAFSIPGAVPHVSLAIYDLQGRLIRTLQEGPLPAGNYTVEWDGLAGNGAEVASGAYVCRLSVGDSASSRTIIKLR